MNILLLVLLLILLFVPLWLLFGKGGSKPAISEQIQTDTPLLDEKDIDLPESELKHPDRRKTRHEELTTVDADFSLPNSSDSIITEDSPFSIYKRTLENAEYYTNNGDFSTALDLYDGLNQRISNEDIRKKINDNIDYLNNYQQISANREKEKRRNDSDGESNEIKLSLGGKDYTPQNVKIDITPSAVNAELNMDSVIETLNEQINRLNPALQQSSEKIEEIIEYKHELEHLKNELKSLHDLKEESHRVREERIRLDIEELKELKSNLQTESKNRSEQVEIKRLKSEIETLRNPQQVANKQQVAISELPENGEQSVAITELPDIAITELPEHNGHNLAITELPDIAITELPDRDEQSITIKELPDIQIKKIPEAVEQQVAITAMPKPEEMEALKLKIETLSNDLTIRQEGSANTEYLQRQIEDLKKQIDSDQSKNTEIATLHQNIETLHQKLNSSQQNDLEIEKLHNKIAELESGQKKEEITGAEKENELLRSQVETMQQQLEEIREHVSSESELQDVKERLSKFENRAQSNSVTNDQIKKMADEIESLADETRQSDNIDKKLDSLLKSELASLSKRDSHQQIEQLTAQIESLRAELDGSNNATTTAPSAPSSAEAMTSAGSSLDIHKKKNNEDASTPDSVTTQDTNLQINAEDSNADDKKDDFETIEEYINGPKFDEPSEDEILEKILYDSAKDDQKDYEIRGTEDNKDYTDDFDISKLFAKPIPAQTQDEEFYNQFTERNKTRVKKELPILHVSYKFDKLPERSALSKESNVIANTFYRYKDLLEKANEHIKRRRVKDALNYYQVVLDQDIPEEFKQMLQQNISDLKEYLEKYMLNM